MRQELKTRIRAAGYAREQREAMAVALMDLARARLA